MASLSVFTPYVDKENVTDAGTRKGMVKSTHGDLKAHVGKTFQSNIGHTPLRRALGSVNRDHINKSDGPQQMQKPQQMSFGKQSLCLQPPTPASKPPKQKSEKPRAVQQQQPPKVKEIPRLPGREISVYMDEIERMPAVDENDNFDNVWAAAERPATYLKELKEWRAWPFSGPADLDLDTSWVISDEDDVDLLDPIQEHTGEEEEEQAMPVFEELLLTFEDLQLPTWEQLELYLDCSQTTQESILHLADNSSQKTL